MNLVIGKIIGIKLMLNYTSDQTASWDSDDIVYTVQTH